MKREAAIPLSIAIAALTLFVPHLALAKTTTPSHPSGAKEARLMVGARANLVETIDARKVQPGHKIMAALNENVHLKNGTELPRGTKLIGTVAADQLEQGGASHSRLALTFTKAELKSGKIIPIKATIMGISKPGYDAYDDGTADVGPAPWHGSTLQLDQVDALHGVDLHSKIASKDSGVLVFRRKDVRLSKGSQMELAIAARQSSHS